MIYLYTCVNLYWEDYRFQYMNMPCKQRHECLTLFSIFRPLFLLHINLPLLFFNFKLSQDLVHVWSEAHRSVNMLSSSFEEPVWFPCQIDSWFLTPSQPWWYRRQSTVLILERDIWIDTCFAPSQLRGTPKRSEKSGIKLSWMDREGRKQVGIEVLSAGTAYKAIFWPTLGLEEETFACPELPSEGGP